MQTHYSIKRRLISIIMVSAFIFFLLGIRLFYIQIIWGTDLISKAQSQWMRSLPLTAQRGDILDRDGNIIVSSQTSYNIYVRPRNILDATNTAKILSDILTLNYENLYNKITKKGVSEVTIIKNADENTINTIKKYNLSGIYIASSVERMYVDGNLLSQILGYVSSDNKGQAGIESYYEKYLRGINGKILTPSDLIGVELNNDEIKYLTPIKGCNVMLTIDLEIQMAVEKILSIAYKAHNPKRVSSLVMDVTNGEILAMGSYPGVDLSNLPRDNLEILQENTRNVLLTDVYEPGSTFKILTAAASLEEYKNGNPKAFSADYVFRNNSNYRVVDKGAKIKCWTTHANGKHANQNIKEALKNSCNPIFTDIALSLGKETFYKYLKAFGYGSFTGIDFSGEQPGLLISQKSVTNGDLARIGFGQSIAVTAIQLANATAAAVNGGFLFSPKLVKGIYDNEGNCIKIFPTQIINQPISEETSKTIAQMLEYVVENGGGKNAYIEGYNVGGKTGTAQKFIDGKLAIGKYVSSFVGFFPSNNPKYLTLFIVDEPVGQSYGSIVAAPYAKMIFENIINLKNISPQG